MNRSEYEALCGVAGPVSRETYERLKALERLFVKWNARINLTSNSTLGDLWTRHILDSAQLAALAPSELHWLDLGSGGGFPGAVMAVLLAERAGSTIDLVESNGKKAAFLTSALADLGPSVKVHQLRIEDAAERIESADVVSARALAPLPKLLDLASPWLVDGGRGLFHKGREYRSELKESAHAWSFDLVEHRSRIDPEGVILDIRNLRPSRRAASD